MFRGTRLGQLLCAVTLAGAAALPAEAVRICQNVCTCSASCALTCRDDAFVPTTCGASIYDCVDKCIVIAPAAAASETHALALEPAPAAPQAGSCAASAGLPFDLD